MSIVLEALSKAEKEKKQGIFNQYQEKKMHDIKSSYQKAVGWIIALNICIIVILIVLIIHYLFHKNDKTKPPEAVKSTTPLIKEKQVSYSDPLQIPNQLILYKNYIQIPNGPEIKISGRIQDKDAIYILVGPEMYKIGDSIGDAILTDIQLKKVKIKYKEQEYEIPTV